MKLSQLLKIFDFPILVLLSHLILIPLNAYIYYPSIDLPMHFLGGLAVSISFIRISKILQKSNHLKTAKLISFVFIISLVALTAMLWEFFEFLLHIFLNFQWQEGYTDTIIDMFLGLIGGIFGFLIKNRN